MWIITLGLTFTANDHDSFLFSIIISQASNGCNGSVTIDFLEPLSLA